ncbi:hypothetical protein JMM81_16850 [Bacillus sp. V3B]|uniref:hypothetical protein n=1 Tax=Bacillus sp. V3B TaxID=2804915 RepID=UPI00210E84BC|nr:hypothetical protein [Bacillus sp. V3B]MCQ6276583.1 hypothetical protein [Bacillus sp. V3B]
MKNEELDFQLLVEKAIENAPNWIKDDIDQILKKEKGLIRLSYVISELHSRYTFGLRHITSAMHRNSDWSVHAFERLNYIDNNVDLIDYILKKRKKERK